MRRAVAAVLVVVLVSFTGCLGGSVEAIDADITPDAEPVDANVTGDEILASALNSTGDVETYSVEGRNLFAFGASQFFNVNISMESTSRFNVGDEESVVETEGVTDFSFLGLLDNTTEFETTVYSRGNLTQRRMTENGKESGWSNAEGNYTMTEKVFGTDAVSWVGNGTDAELLGEQRVNGVDSYVLRLNVTQDTYESIFMHSTAAVGLGAGGLDDREQDEEVEQPEEGEFNVTDPTAPDVYIWVDKETDRPVRFAYLLSVDTQDSGGEGNESGIDASFGMLHEADYSYEEVDVEPPEGL